MGETLNNQEEVNEDEVVDETIDSEETDSETNWEEEATKWKEQATKWKAFSRKNENALEALKKQAPQTSGNADEDLKTLKAALENSEAEIAKYKKQGIVSDILKEYGLPNEAASLLVGNTEEELETSAEALKALLGGKAKNPVIPTQGLSSGKAPKVELTVEEETAAYLAANKNKRR